MVLYFKPELNKLVLNRIPMAVGRLSTCQIDLIVLELKVKMKILNSINHKQ